MPPVVKAHMKVLTVYQLGMIEYDRAYHFQQKLLKQRIEGEIEDTLLILEHPPTLTFVKSDDLENLLISRDGLQERGVSLFPTDRGGNITWHGPGQVVGYPIMNLQERDKDIHKFIFDLQEVIIRVLNDFSIEAFRDERHVGVWVGQEKIAAIGIKVTNWVTKHGFALNVNNDLEYFSLINPCGIMDKGVTSMARILGRDVPMETVVKRILGHFSSVFGTLVEMESNSFSQVPGH